MKRILLLPCLLGGVLASSAQAQRLSSSLQFSMPSDVDPDTCTIKISGHLYTTDDSGNPLTGGTALTTGLNIIGDIPIPAGGTAPIVELIAMTPYTGPLTLSTNTGSFSQFTPWSVQNIDFAYPGQQAWDLRMQPGSAPLNVGSYESLITANSNDPAFASANFTYIGYTSFQTIAPEPGTLALFGSLATACGLLLLRRARSKIDHPLRC